MIYLNLGRREQGKTTLALFLTRKVGKRVVFDPRGLVPAARARVTFLAGIRPALDTLWSAPMGADVVMTPDTLVQPFFDTLCREVKNWIREGSAPPIAFVVDELRFVDTRAEAFDWLTRCATRAQILIVGTAHRPADVSVDLRAIVDVWCLFQMTQEHDLRVLEERCSIRVANTVKTLRPREFVVWDDTRAVMRTYRDPASWYVPLQEPGTLPDETTADFPEDAKSVDTDKLFR